MERTEDSSLIAKASNQSLVKSFSISGLYGYRNVSMESSHSATILIARNGAGKTTLISALHAVLLGQFSRLQSLDFSEIRCGLSEIKAEIVIKRADLDAYLELPADGDFSRQARRIEVDPASLFRFVMEEYPWMEGDYKTLSSHPIHSALERSVGYRSDEVKKICERLNDSSDFAGSTLHQSLISIRKVTSSYDIVYLPTYRRVELPLSKESKDAGPKGRRTTAVNRLSGSLLAGDVQFGLSDISEHLSELNQRILLESNFGYRRISADIISELIAKDLNDVASTEGIPQREELNLFFSRLKDSSRRGPFIGDVSIPDIDQTYETSTQKTGSGIFLRYFLSKLNTVIQATRDIEQRVQDFIFNCNRYLSSQDMSTSLADEREITSSTSDDKVLRLNRRNLSVHAESLIGGRRISLDALSSGEKQMVSLFAKLYLYEKPKIVLIDEPEISLSLSWQRLILVDILRAPLCRQIVAITHSPFVFDNILDPFAKALNVSVDLSALPQSDNDSIEEEQ